MKIKPLFFNEDTFCITFFYILSAILLNISKQTWSIHSAFCCDFVIHVVDYLGAIYKVVYQMVCQGFSNGGPKMSQMAAQEPFLFGPQNAFKCTVSIEK